jgi:hypothetical protein
LNPGESAYPDKKNSAVYRDLQALQNNMSRSLLDVFTQHREFVLRES